MLYALTGVSAALFLAALFTEALRAFAVRTGPPGRPAPRSGGAAVVAAMLTVAAIGRWAVPVPLLAAGGAVALLGLACDLRPAACDLT